MFLLSFIIPLQILASDNESFEDTSSGQEAGNPARAEILSTSLVHCLTEDSPDFLDEINKGKKIYKSFLASKHCLNLYFYKNRYSKTYPFKEEVNEALALRKKYITSGFKEEIFTSAENKE